MQNIVDEKAGRIVAKGWENVTREDLKYLYFDKNMIKAQIADLFGVEFNQVNYKLKKFDLNGQRKMLSDALDYALSKVKQVELKKMIFASDRLNNNLEEDFNWGPVKVVDGEFKGRIGYLGDEEDGFGIVYWGNTVEALDSYCKIEMKYLSGDITCFDLVERGEYLADKIARLRCENLLKNANYLNNLETISNLYGEYVYILGLLNSIYEETFYLKSDEKKNVFLSYSSKDKSMALWIATDLRRSGYNVWFDVWDIDGGHSIPDEIGRGIDSADAMVMLVSETYNQSVYCRDEWQSFYMKYSKTKPNSIIPIILNNATVPTLISNRRYLSINDNSEYNSVLKELKRALKKL